MTELEKKAMSLTQEEIDVLYKQVLSEGIDVSEEDFCLCFIAKQKTTEMKLDYVIEHI